MISLGVLKLVSAVLVFSGAVYSLHAPFPLKKKVLIGNLAKIGVNGKRLNKYRARGVLNPCAREPKAANRGVSGGKADL